MKSFPDSIDITFDVLRARLVEQVMLRIDNGEFTERGFARIVGISQPQMHNVLKGVRNLNLRLADRILAKLGLSALDLLSEAELKAGLQSRLTESKDRPENARETRLDTTQSDLTALLKSLKKPAGKSEIPARGIGHRAG